MFNGSEEATAAETRDADLSQLQAPYVARPVTYGETFEPDASTGAAWVRVPITAPEGPRGEPGLELGYLSGRGNGTFGLGFALNLLSVSRRTDHGVPRYDDSDRFLLGASELVHAHVHDGTRWRRDTRDEQLDGRTHRVVGYHQRVQDGSVRIECWTSEAERTPFWTVVDQEGTTTYYGRTEESRIADPDDPARIFAWLPEERADALGNRIVYRYDSDVGTETGHDRRANRYPVSIHYGNHTVAEGRETFAFEVRFEYRTRRDTFSSYRAGFEVRTTRLCDALVGYHRFAELGPEPVVVGAMRFQYDESPGGALLRSVRRVGSRRDGVGQVDELVLPATRMRYTPYEPAAASFRRLDVAFPGVPGADGCALVDLYGDGLAGVLHPRGEVWLYSPPLGAYRYGPPEPLPSAPVEHPSAFGSRLLVDVAGDGHLDLVVGRRDRGGFYGNNNDGTWEPYRDFPSYAGEFGTDGAELADVRGAGLPDVFVPLPEGVRYYLSRGDAGYDAPAFAAATERSRPVPSSSGGSHREVVQFADMFGDGLAHRVRVTDGRVEVWPNLGYGRFAGPLVMAGSPRFGPRLTAARVLLADVSGSGTADLLLVHGDHVDLHLNESGNRFGEAIRIEVPMLVGDQDRVGIADVTGSGRPGLVISKSGPEPAHHVLDFSPDQPPYWLAAVSDGRGTTTTVEYRSSTDYALEAARSGRPWTTKLATPVQVISASETVDAVTGTTSWRRFTYRNGYFDPVERAFRGFGMVECRTGHEAGAGAVESSVERSWSLMGDPTDWPQLHADYRGDYFCGDPAALTLPPLRVEPSVGVDGPATLRQAHAALASRLIRSETWGPDDADTDAAPMSVSEACWEAHLIQPPLGGAPGVFSVRSVETAHLDYDGAAEDPMVEHELTLAWDAHDNPQRTLTVHYPRRPQDDEPVLPGQAAPAVTLTTIDYVNHPGPGFRVIGLPFRALEFELGGLPPTAPAQYWSHHEAAGLVDVALSGRIVPYGEPFAGDGVQARLTTASEWLFWNPDLSGPLPLGEVSAPALLHHRREAVFPQTLVDRVFGPKVTGAMLAEHAGYELRSGVAPEPDYWWSRGPVTGYAGPDSHFVAVSTTDPFGATTAYTYDRYALVLVGVKDPLGDSMTAVVDYWSMGYASVTDPNGIVTQTLYDPLGEPYVTSIRAREGAYWVGGMDLAEYIPREGTTAQVLADPQHYLQGASHFSFTDARAWERDGTPISTVSLAARDWCTPPGGHAAIPGPVISAQIEHEDGFGRVALRKEAVEARAAAGPPKTGGNLWVVTEDTVHSGEGGLLASGLPRFTPDAGWEGHLSRPAFRFTRDALGRPVRTDTPKGFFTRVVYAPWSHAFYDEDDTVVESDFYRAHSNDRSPGFVAERAALGLAATFADTPVVSRFDVRGHQIQTSQTNIVPGTVPVRERLDDYYWLDSRGNRLRIADARFWRPDDHEHSHPSFLTTFDMLSRAISAWSADAGTALTLFDALGEEVDRWDQAGNHVSTTRDTLRRVLAIHVQGPGVQQTTRTFTYGTDAGNRSVGRLVERRDEAGIATWPRFDLLGNATVYEQRVLSDLDALVSWDDPAQVSLMPDVWHGERDYDALGQLVRELHPDGSRTVMNRYSNGWLEGVEAVFADEDTARDVISGVTYVPSGERASLVYGCGARSVLSYDPLAETLTSVATTDATGTPLLATSCTYDPVGNVTRRVVECTGPDGDSGPHRTQGYFAFDAVYRLLSATGREATDVPSTTSEYLETYSYDRSRNLVAIKHQARPPAPSWTREVAVSDSSNHAVPRSMIDGTTPDDFFRCGDMVALDSTTMTYDYRHALVSTVTRTEAADGERARMLVAADQARTRRVREGPAGLASTDTLYIGGYVEERTPADGPQSTVRLLQITDDDGDVLMTRMWGDAWSEDRYPLRDELGSVLVELDARSGVLTVEEYSPWGETTLTRGATEAALQGKRFHFGGKERDVPTGFYYFGARYYAPGIGRWTQPDPLATVDGLNLYAYVDDNPVTWLDPFGFAKQRKAFAVSLQQSKHGGLALKVQGRPQKFITETLSALYHRYASQHVTKTRLKPGLSRNHQFPWFGISKYFRSVTRGFTLQDFYTFLSPMVLHNPHWNQQFHTLVSKGLKTTAEVSEAVKFVLLDRYNDPRNIYIGDSALNSRSGSLMKRNAVALSRDFHAPAHLKMTNKERTALQNSFLIAALDFGPGTSSKDKKKIKNLFKKAFGRKHGEYMP
ncbi:SpvB/TcaC N-terminal domain-containing protein [Streptomyces albogriseolus]|uniref:SpvB/TcaC N-terminal domain-containing protein n=1 Tax=Streptomyces albogriseolus TaxID=1887 RepID=UPI003D70A83E